MATLAPFLHRPRLHRPQGLRDHAESGAGPDGVRRREAPPAPVPAPQRKAACDWPGVHVDAAERWTHGWWSKAGAAGLQESTGSRWRFVPREVPLFFGRASSRLTALPSPWRPAPIPPTLGHLAHSAQSTFVMGSTLGPLCGLSSPRTRTRRSEHPGPGNGAGTRPVICVLPQPEIGFPETEHRGPQAPGSDTAPHGRQMPPERLRLQPAAEQRAPKPDSAAVATLSSAQQQVQVW